MSERVEVSVLEKVLKLRDNGLKMKEIDAELNQRQGRAAQVLTRYKSRQGFIANATPLSALLTVTLGIVDARRIYNVLMRNGIETVMDLAELMDDISKGLCFRGFGQANVDKLSSAWDTATSESWTFEDSFDDKDLMKFEFDHLLEVFTEAGVME